MVMSEDKVKSSTKFEKEVITLSILVLGNFKKYLVLYIKNLAILFPIL